MPVTLPFDNLDMPLPLLDSASFVDLPLQSIDATHNLAC